VGTVTPAGEAYLAFYIGRLRQKLEVDPSDPRSLRAVEDGYAFATTSASRRKRPPRDVRRGHAPAETRQLTVFTIGLDRPMAGAIWADLPRARILAMRPHRADGMGARRRTPDLVILNASATDTTTQRRLVQQTWATAVVVELSTTETRALVRCYT
jgi:hypothetical protein